MTNYYDYVLATIPLVLFGGSGVLSIGGLSMSTAVPAAGLVAIAVVVHALFVNGPRDTPGHDGTGERSPFDAD